MLTDMWKSALVLASLSLAGCASVASGPYGTHLDAAGKPSAAAAQSAKLMVSAREIPEMSSRYFGEIEFTLENPTAQWVRVDKVVLDFGNPKINQSVYFPWGSQLDNWLEATRQRNAIQEENFAMTVAVLGLGAGMVSMAASGQPAGLRMAGGLATLAALAGAAAIATGEPTAAVADGPVFVGRHLLAVPIEVPPGLFVKRFIVVNTPGDPGLGCLATLIMSYELADKTTHRVAVGFRSGDNSHGASQWQANACPRGEQ
jgi:hypothetical protein